MLKGTIKSTFARHAAGLYTGLCTGLNAAAMALAPVSMIPAPGAVQTAASLIAGLGVGYVFCRYAAAGAGVFTGHTHVAQPIIIHASDAVYGMYGAVSGALYTGIAVDLGLGMLGFDGRAADALAIASGGVGAVLCGYTAFLGSIMHVAQLAARPRIT